MNVLKPHLQTTIWTLLRAGNTQREIERRTGISRHTIRAWAKRFEAQGTRLLNRLTIQTAPGWPPTWLCPWPAKLLHHGHRLHCWHPPRWPPPLCEPHRAFIEAQLRLGRNATAIYQDLVDAHGFAGRYNSVKRFVARIRVREPEQFDRLSFLPGEEMQVDFGEGAPTRVPGTDRWRKPRLFVATLRYSRRSFRRVVWNSGQQVWAELHEQAWRYFGGSCRYVVLDNLKEGVLKPDLYEPELNPCTPPPWRTTRSWPTLPACVTPTARAVSRMPLVTLQATAPQGQALRDHRGAKHLPRTLGDQVGSLAHPRCRAPSGAGHVRRRAAPPAALAHAAHGLLP